VPFDGSPATVRFAFSSREHPFTLAILFLGGGGFFSISLSIERMEELEASLEVGAILALNLGVASGSVSVFFGIYFRLKNVAADKSELDLTAYVRINGSVEVLGIITISLTVLLELQYKGSTNSLWGRATVTLRVEVLFFSVEVEATVEREIPGSGAALGGLGPSVAGATRAPEASDGGGYSFVDAVPTKARWDTYCGAFG
jgi:hypothetical protein